MKLDCFILVAMGYFIRIGEAGKDHHVKIYVPHTVHHHKHVHTVYKQPKIIKKIIVHKHEHNHGHGHDHGHHHGHKHGHKHDHNHGHKHDHHHKHKHHGKHMHKHKHGHEHHHDKHHHHHHDKHHNHHGLVQQLPPAVEDNYDPVPETEVVDYYPYDDGYQKSHKSLRSEKFHVQEVKNSQANNDIDKHFLAGSYKVEENPDDYNGNTAYHKVFQAPVANINLQKTAYGGGGSTSDSEEDASEYDYAKMDDQGDGNEYQEEGYTANPDHGKLKVEQHDGNEALRQFYNGV